jgi:hypothetical protein
MIRKGRFTLRSLSPGYLLAILALVAALAFWCVHPNFVWDMDSLGYVQGSPARTATYHLFLAVFYGPWLLPVQLFLFAAALGWLAIYSSRLVPWIVCAGLFLLIAANPYVWELQASVMSEALTTPLLTIIVGCVLGFTATRRNRLLLVAAFLCGLATTARPSLILFIIAPLCLLWMAREASDRWKTAAAMILLFAAPIVAEKLYSRAVHGSQLTSYVGRNVFMKGAIIDAPPTGVASPDALDQRLLAGVNQEYEPVRRLISGVQDRDVRYVVMTLYESCAGYGCFDDFLAGYYHGEAELERHMFKVGAARLRSNPAAYAKLAATEYQRMFLLHPRKHPDLAPKYNAFLARQSPIPFQQRLGAEAQPTPADQQKPLLRFNRAVFALIGIFGVLMTGAFAFWRPNRPAEAAFALLLGTQAVLVFTTLLGVGQPRYAMGMWPALIGGEFLAAVALLEVWFARRGSDLLIGRSVAPRS